MVGWTVPEYTYDPRKTADFRASGVIFPGVSAPNRDGWGWCDAASLARDAPESEIAAGFGCRGPAGPHPLTVSDIAVSDIASAPQRQKARPLRDGPS